MASRSPLAPRSSNKDGAPTPQFYKLLEPSSEDEMMPPPPPPPAFENESVAPPPPDTPADPRRALGLCLGGHASFAYVYFTSSMTMVSVAAWLFLSALILNAIKISVTGTSSTIPRPDATRIIEGVNAAVDQLNRLTVGEPKITFTVACCAWAFAVISSMVSPLTLAWIGYCYASRTTLLSADASGKLNSIWIAAAAKASSFATEERREALYAALGPRLDQVAAMYARVAGELRVNAEGIKFVAPMAGVVCWMFLLGWTNKFLLGGMGLLAYKAWASPEAAAKFDAKIGKAARASRRMTLSAADRMGLMKPKVA